MNDRDTFEMDSTWIFPTHPLWFSVIKWVWLCLRNLTNIFSQSAACNRLNITILYPEYDPDFNKCSSHLVKLAPPLKHLWVMIILSIKLRAVPVWTLKDYGNKTKLYHVVGCNWKNVEIWITAMHFTSWCFPWRSPRSYNWSRMQSHTPVLEVPKGQGKAHAC